MGQAFHEKIYIFESFLIGKKHFHNLYIHIMISSDLMNNKTTDICASNHHHHFIWWRKSKRISTEFISKSFIKYRIWELEMDPNKQNQLCAILISFQLIFLQALLVKQGLSVCWLCVYLSEIISSPLIGRKLAMLPGVIRRS